MLHPYSSNRMREHFGTQRGPHSRSTYGVDTSGTVTYAFNSLGFRGEEYDAGAKAKLFFCGCSHTFGTGLDSEATWVSRFAAQYAQHVGLDHEDVCAMNFSQGGSSNSYIARTLMTQCAAAKPDLVVAHFTSVERTEYYLDPDEVDPSDWTSRLMGVLSMGPWLDVGWFEKLTLGRKAPPARQQQARKLLDWAKHYYCDTYTDLNAIAATILHILNLQSYCSANGIPWLACWVEHQRLVDEKLLGHATLGPLIQLLDRDRVLSLSITDAETQLDKAADGVHLGVDSNQAFARRLWEQYLDSPSGPPAEA